MLVSDNNDIVAAASGNDKTVVVKEAWEVWEGWTCRGSLDSLRK